MPTAILTPRVNNNDDLVRFSRTYVEPGAGVRKGDIIAEIETDKASVTVEAEADGYLLGFVHAVGETIPVGSTLAWMGSDPREAVPEEAAPAEIAVTGGAARGAPTLKASLLLARLGLNAVDIPASGERLTAEDVLRFADRHRSPAAADNAPAARSPEPALELAPGRRVPLDVVERGMLRTVRWHRDSAVAGYVEVDVDTAAWDARAAAFQQRHGLLMSPLLPLLAYRLVELARETPKINSTIAGDARHEYSAVNLGFTIQSGSRLALLSVRDAGSMDAKAFVDALSALMRRGMKNRLTADETSDVTISFSSMARWQVRRHVPVLPPFTALIVAHTHERNGVAALGASYDHRVLTGGEVAAILNRLAGPAPGQDAAPEPTA